METRDIFKRYLIYSIGFHLIVLVLLIFFGEAPPVREERTTQITMLRFTRSAGSTSSPLLKKSGAPGESTAPPVPVPEKPPEKPAEKPPEKPAVKVPPPPIPEKPPPAKPPEKTAVVPPVKKPPQKIPPPTPTGPAPEQPVAPAPPQKPSPDEQKIAEALAGVKGELQERETQSQTPAAPSGENPGPGSAPGAPGGAEGSPFGSPSGAVAATDPALSRYQSQVRSKIIREWVRTASGAEGEVLRARVVVRINASGGVVSSSLAKRSGNASFDNSALRAVERASPLPSPPQLILAEALQEGFVIDFSSRMLK